MKRIILFFALFFSIAVNAQIKEGRVVFTMELTGGPSNDNMAAALLKSSTMTVSFKNDKSLTEMVTAVYAMRTITDSKGSLMLMDGGGEKVYTRMSKEDIERNKPKNNNPVVVITKEKKKILGYDCTKATISMTNAKGRPSTTVIWFTNKIQAAAVAGLINTDALSQIKGFPLEVEMDQGPIRSKFTAKEVSLKPIPDASFALSTAGYTEKKPTPQIKRP